MKHTTIIIYTTLMMAALLHHKEGMSQNKPVAYSNGMAVNYIRSWDAQAPETDPAVLVTRPMKDVMQSTLFFDGLGRPLQKIIKKGSLVSGQQATDLVSPIVYDNMGRQVYKYLPFGANTTGGYTATSDGSFKLNPFDQQAYFYSDNNGYSPIKGQGETYYYAQTDYEASPLNRVNKVYEAGNSWVQAGRGIGMQYLINKTVDDVKIWNVSDVPGSLGSYSASGAYTEGTLNKTLSKDEQGAQVIEFRDKEDKLILKKVQLTGSADNGDGIGYPGWLCTYYIYDNLDNLRCVIQPLAVEQMANTGVWQLSAAQLDELCFRYEYDGRKRMTIKKQPGAGEVWMVYDIRDRLVFIQDANMRGSQWVTTLYNGLNQPVMTGITSYTGDRSTLQGLVTSQTTPFNAPNDETIIQGVAVNKNPLPSVPSFVPVSITYFDNYDWTSQTYTTTYNSNLDAGNNPYAEALPAQKSSRTLGLVTGIKLKTIEDPANLTAGKWLTTINFYDDKARVIQAQSINYKDGADILTSLYDFSGKVLCNYLVQNNPGATPASTRIKTNFDYDDLQRTTAIWKTLNDNAADKKLIVQNTYDAVGHLRVKKIAPAFNSNAGLESLTYDYNIRGWLLGANQDFIKDVASNKFGFELGYDKTATVLGSAAGQSFAAAMYNGNINGTLWKSAGDNEKRKYDFNYDAANRITGADFNQYTGVQFNRSAGLDFSMTNCSYDANGNIHTMQHTGWKINGSQLIDDLKYTYINNGNRLQNIKDFQNDALTSMGDFRTSTLHPQSTAKQAATTDVDLAAITDYTYDGNGNLKKDLNKDMGSTGADGIIYNHLNLPWKVTVNSSTGTKGTITYIYDAAGNKLKKVVQETGQPDKATVYIGGCIYENDVLKLINHEEGRIRFERATTATCTALPDRFVYDYFLKDHLGNTRMVLTEQQEATCYPAATLEPSRVTNEKIFYNITDGRVTDKSTTGATQSSFETKLYQVHGGISGQKTGLEIVLKVMSGDQVRITGESYYTLPGGGSAGSPLTMSLTDLLTALAGNGLAVGKGVAAAADISNVAGNTSFLNTFIGSNNPGSNTAKAAINWILFDEQFKYVTADFDGVQANGGYKLHTKFINTPVNVSKNGYLYIYVSNESNLPVYFDNLAVTHTPGPIVEETHYYPFGLTMAAISSKILPSNYTENKFKFNGAEFNSVYDINQYEFFYRNYDPQIGRWHGLDPKPNESVSLYSAMNNNPVLFNDLLGDTTIFYDNNNNLLATLPDGAESVTLTFIPTESVKQFRGSLQSQVRGQEAELGEVDYGQITPGLRQMGLSYEMEEYIKFDNANNNDVYKGKDFEPIDGKGPLKNEHSATLDEKNGYMEVGKKTYTGDPGGVDGYGESTIHNHVNEGRRYNNYKDQTQNHYKTPEDGGMNTDIRASTNRNGTGKFDVTVIAGRVILYNNEGIQFSYKK
jgi:RHS repeat-associated protein